MGRVEVQQPVAIGGVSAPAHLFRDEGTVLELRDGLGQEFSDLLARLVWNGISGILSVRPWLTGLPSVRQDDFVRESGELVANLDLTIATGFEEEAWKDKGSRSVYGTHHARMNFSRLTFLQIHHDGNALELLAFLGRQLDMSQCPAFGLQLPLCVE